MVVELYEQISTMETATADPFTMIGIAASATAYYPNSPQHSREQKINEYLDQLGVCGNDHTCLFEMVNQLTQTLIGMLQAVGVNIQPGMNVQVVRWLGYDAAIKITGWTAT